MTNEQKYFLRCLLALDQALLTNPIVIMILSDTFLNGHAALLDYLASSLITELGDDTDDFQCEVNVRTLSSFLRDSKSVGRVKDQSESQNSIFKNIKQNSKFDILKAVEKFLGEDNEDD